LLTTSIGTLERDAKVAACLRRSCGRRWIPTILPAFMTICRAASYDIGKIRSLLLLQLCSVYSLSRSATFCGMNPNSRSFPLLGFRRISFRPPWTSPFVSFSTSPTRRPPLAISSSISRFLGFMVLHQLSEHIPAVYSGVRERNQIGCYHYWENTLQLVARYFSTLFHPPSLSR